MPRSWDLSPEDELDAAITWFKQRTAMPNTWADAAHDNARRTGFWMSKVVTSQRAARIQRSLEDAMAHGMTFETWRKNNKGILKRIPKAHLQTTFRNWTQTTLNNARVNYLLSPEVKKRRPYWVFDAVMDGNTTPVCSHSDGVVLPAGHKWFLSHTPPLHHNCRSHIRGLTKRAAEKRGIRQRAPSSKRTAPDAGFGKAIVKPWSPDKKDFPAALRPPRKPATQKPRRVAAEKARPVPLADIPRTQRPRRPKLGPEKTPELAPNLRQAVNAYSLTEFSETRDAYRMRRKAWLAKYPNKTAQDYKTLKNRALDVSTAIRSGESKARKLYRGVEVDRATAEQIAGTKFFTTDTITSTSLRPSIAEDFAREFPDDEFVGVIFEVKSRGLELGEISANQNEREVLIAPGRAYRTVSVGRLRSGQMVVRLEEIASNEVKGKAGKL